MHDTRPNQDSNPSRGPGTPGPGTPGPGTPGSGANGSGANGPDGVGSIEELVAAPARPGPAEILLVYPGRQWPDDLLALLRDRGERCVVVGSRSQAEAAMVEQRFDLVIADLELSDGTAIDLASFVDRQRISTRVIIVSERLEPADVMAAMRSGVIDCLQFPVRRRDFFVRIDAALARTREDQQRRDHVERLQALCRRLSAARQEISDQVDTLCTDLVHHSQDISQQMDEIAMASEFRTLIRQELDVEDLLRTALEFLLVKTGPLNAAVFLPNADGEYALGAYVNYDCPRESVGSLIDHLGRWVCPIMADEPDILAFDDPDELGGWIGADIGELAECQVVMLSCHHEGECLAVAILFRQRDEPFDDATGHMLDLLRPIFAEQIATVIRVHHRASPSWPDDAHGEDEFDFNEDYEDYGFGGLAA